MIGSQYLAMHSDVPSYRKNAVTQEKCYMKLPATIMLLDQTLSLYMNKRSMLAWFFLGCSVLYVHRYMHCRTNPRRWRRTTLYTLKYLGRIRWIWKNIHEAVIHIVKDPRSSIKSSPSQLATHLRKSIRNKHVACFVYSRTSVHKLCTSVRLRRLHVHSGIWALRQHLGSYNE